MTISIKGGAISAFCVYSIFLLGSSAEALPPTPPQGTPVCDATVNGTCYVTGDFDISTFSPGATHYRVCRSDDGRTGCDFTIETEAQMPFRIAGEHVPNEGQTRAYKFRACDSPSSCTPWSDSVPAFVTRDSAAPSAPGAVNVGTCADGTSGNDCWVGGPFTIYSSAATDATSGVKEYEFCRSHDNNGGFGGCNVKWQQKGAVPQLLVQGSDLPTEGNRRAYRIRAYDQVGLVGAWATPLYVRVDYRDPQVSASQASSTTVSVTASDDAGGTAANSGLDEVRYRWNQPFDAFCNGGNVWTSGTLTVPAGQNDLYLCAMDHTGRQGRWQGPFENNDLLPTTDGAWVQNPVWTVDRTQEYSFMVTAFDADGLKEVRAAINYGTPDLRGIFSWRDESAGYTWWKDQVQCAGGGLGSMNRNSQGSRVTLTGCSTSLDPDGQRFVTFTVRPNESFGVFNQSLDISARAWDMNDNSSSWQHYDLNFTSVRPGDQLGTGYGYQGILDIPSFNQSVQANLPVNITTLLYTSQRYICNDMCRRNPAYCQDNPSYWETADTAGIMGVYEQNNAKAMVIMENFLFRDELDSIDEFCRPVTVPTPTPGTCEAETNQRWRLRPDWQQRLDTFANLHGGELNSSNVAFMLMTSEINDRCFDPAEVEMAAQAVRNVFPFKLGMFYGATYDSNHVLDSQPAPSSFPSIFDVVGLFSYRNLDINNPVEPKNAAEHRFYNPEIPTDTSTIYGDLLSKLHGHQEVLLVFGMQDSQQHTNLGWTEEDFGIALLNYAEFMSYRPEVTILGGFTFQGLLSRPPLVQDTARTVGCTYFANGSPLCLP